MAKEREAAKDVALKIRPLDDRVVVEPLEAEDKTAGGIILPDAAKQKPQRGRVLAVGPGRLRDSGDRSAVSVGFGDAITDTLRAWLSPEFIYSDQRNELLGPR